MGRNPEINVIDCKRMARLDFLTPPISFVESRMRRCNQLILSALLVGACGDSGPPRIGVVVSAAPGQAAALVAADQQPDQPGYFEAIIADGSVRDAAEAIRQAEEFSRDPRILAVIGHGNSTSSLAGSQIYNAAGLVQIAPTTTAPVYGQAGRFSFRLVPSDTLQAAYLSKARRHHGPAARRLAVIHVNDDYGRGLLRALRPQLGELVFEGLYSDGADSTHIALLHDGIAASRPDLLIWLGRPGSLGELLKRLRASTTNVAVICGDACDSPVVYQNTDDRFTGLFFVRFTNPATPDSALRAFQGRYLALTGQVASSEALLTFDAVSLVRAALHSGARSREDVRRYLRSLGAERPAFEGLTGRIEFDASGAFARSYMLAEVRADSVAAAPHMQHGDM
jgi:branched-chain amino acid transport system substrate-binding protein